MKYCACVTVASATFGAFAMLCHTVSPGRRVQLPCPRPSLQGHRSEGEVLLSRAAWHSWFLGREKYWATLL